MWRWNPGPAYRSLCASSRPSAAGAGRRAQRRPLLVRSLVYPENKLGNILDRTLQGMVHSPQQKNFGNAKEFALLSDCRQCDVRFACNGECPKHRFTTTATGEYGLNYLCAGYKHFFRHIDPHMRFMANELKKNGAPARVMEWAEREETAVLQAQPAHSKEGRNAHSPCRDQYACTIILVFITAFG